MHLVVVTAMMCIRRGCSDKDIKRYVELERINRNRQKSVIYGTSVDGEVVAGGTFLD